MLVLVLGTSFLAFVALRGGARGDGREPGAPGTTAEGTDDTSGPSPPLADSGAGRSAEAREGAEDEPGLGARGPTSAAISFEDGRGTLRGHVEVDGPDPFPSTWTLRLEPSTTLLGREHAESRVIEFEDGRQDFTVEGLALAGYDVIAEAPGWNGLRAPVLLHEGSPAVFLNLRMVRAGSVRGRVLDAAGAPAEGVTVTLTRVGSIEAREARTDMLGSYAFDEVLDGAYHLGVGPLFSPLPVEPRALRVQSPGITLPDIELPPLATFELVVIDAGTERPLPAVKVVGSGIDGGAFDGETDSYGVLVMRHLPPGRWRLRIELEGYRGRRDRVDLVAGEAKSVALALGR